MTSPRMCCVQRKATCGSLRRFAMSHARTGALTLLAQTGVPITMIS
ncbi:hypothetical protein AWB75_02879 [Caballeronia catudaia]|uniref:Uncharacterized protein n=1 Tax=Caballeronia catudaia TaxID=1777136 RepID=A0A158B1T1_9BURK|nr:hypothetical protein [Caballeronia catudaia]SAK63963.1 hypothetical protein AWB75_02879 [Caballeronia catudaia]